MNLTTKRFDKLFNDIFGHFGEKNTSNCKYSYERILLNRESKHYVIHVYRNSELWKTFWVDNRGIDARILDNFNSLSERERYYRTQKPFCRYSTIEEFEPKIKELHQIIFN